eukprot:sb/3478439/
MEIANAQRKKDGIWMAKIIHAYNFNAQTNLTGGWYGGLVGAIHRRPHNPLTNRLVRSFYLLLISSLLVASVLTLHCSSKTCTVFSLKILCYKEQSLGGGP